ncbi:MAG: cation:proton antiporter [Nanoarchaeota archaeon]|nr:cation:proton antiporter [Nanoarchaeota archaeon]
MSNIFFDIGIMIIFATILGYIGRLLKQPLIPLYILAGVIIGPLGFGWITDSETIRTMSEIGIAFLLFVVGLELDLRKLKDVGNVIIAGSVIQIITMFFAGLVIGILLGFANEQLIYLSLIVSFSSTMVVIKLLSDKNELETLHGRIIIGILLMEDIFAILALSIIQTLSDFSVLFLIIAIFKAAGLMLIAYITGKYVFPTIFKFAARSQEILFLIAITTCFSFGIMSFLLGFSIAIGAFIAGVALANLPYNMEIESKVRPLRDFLSTIFFVSLGMALVLNKMSLMIIPLIALIGLIVIFKPIIITLILSFFGYKRKTAFMTSTSLAQSSEFSLIIVAQGMYLGHISQDFLSLATILAITTITITTYFIKFDNQAYQKIGGFLKVFEKLSKKSKELEFVDENSKYRVILVGYDRIGYTISKSLDKLKKDYLVVDFNPDIIKKLMSKKQPCLYGDISDVEIINRLRLEQVELVVSTIPDKHAAKLLIKKVKEKNLHALIIVTTLRIEDALEMYEEGADYVIVPHILGGHQVNILLESISDDIDKLIDTKISHIKELKERKEHTVGKTKTL